MNDLPSIDRQRILAVYAHPDDECYCSGGTLAKYSHTGAEVMVISATKGQAGEINDVHRATRQTLGATRAKELIASCAQLGIEHVECWDYLDGGLENADANQLIGDIVLGIRRFRPHIVITFGPDGAYGHPDHVTIGCATTKAFEIAEQQNAYPEQLSGEVQAYKPLRLYYAHFPIRQYFLLDEIAKWLIENRNHFRGTLNFAHGLSLFAKESIMLHYSSDFVETRWYPPGFCIVEQGESGSDLFIILSGTVEVKRAEADGELTLVAELNQGEFFGEIGAATHHTRTAHVIAKNSVTCLVFSPGQRTNFAGRGDGAILGGAYDTKAAANNTGEATHTINVCAYIPQKIAAIAQHRTQTPITPDMFPTSMLERLFGQEFFVQIYPEVKLATEL